MTYFYCLVVADSRAKKMQRIVQARLRSSGFPIIANFIVLSGANLKAIGDKALEMVETYKYDLVIILGGVNDLSRKTPRGQPLIPVYGSVD